MRWRRVRVLLMAVLAAPVCAFGQAQPPSEYLLIDAQEAITWQAEQESVVQLRGPVRIRLDRADLAADDAVVWLRPARGAMLGEQAVEIALLGNASLAQDGVRREGPRLLVSAMVRGSVRLTVESRAARDPASHALFAEAASLREAAAPADDARPARATTWLPGAPAPVPAAVVRPREPVNFFGDVQITRSPEDRVAVTFSGKVLLTQRRADGSFIELQADRGVLFTGLNRLSDAADEDARRALGDAVEAAYLEGDVRITVTPAPGAAAPEQRLLAERVLYEFASDRAVLTHAVLHTTEPNSALPLIVRATTLKQLTSGEFAAQGAQLSTSSFATPSYGLRADRVYVRQYSTDDPRDGTRTRFRADNVTLRTWGLPVFYWPYAAGSVSDRGNALREFRTGSQSGFGFNLRSEWGLFESIGQPPPRGLDASYRVDWFADRGFGLGLNADYAGGFISETSREPWNFTGDFTGYVVPSDSGKDRLGRDRPRVDAEDDTRGRVRWRHQHFFPEDWQAQVSVGYVSDPTFLEEWFEDDFRNGAGQDISAYLKRQRDNEAFTLLLQVDPNDAPQSADLVQEQFTVERLPQAGYYRVGDSLLDDTLTFFSANTVGGVRFNPSEATLTEQGFAAGQSPGLPSRGLTGVEDDYTLRGDFRQEAQAPLKLGLVNVVPFVVGRLGYWSESPDGSSQDRLLLGAGARASTAFWRVDDAVRSGLLDLNRMRHVVEPELSVHSFGQFNDRTETFLFDEAVEATNDTSAAQVALRQRWQTKRGGPGRWRSVDVFTLDLEGNAFLNQPEEAFLEPRGFRGLYFGSLPEASIPRNSVNAGASWRLSDQTMLIGDAQQNVDENSLATSGLGLLATRSPRVSYFAGVRYIGQVNSTIATFILSYEISTKYRFALTNSLDLGENEINSSGVTLLRRFDRFIATVTVFYDAVEEESGVNFGLLPEGLAAGLNSGQLRNVAGGE